MSDKKTEADVSTLDNSLPSEPVKSEVDTITSMDNSMPTPSVENPVVKKPVVKKTVAKKPVGKPLDNSMPSEPAKTEADTITSMDNSMPAPPALDLDNGK